MQRLMIAMTRRCSQGRKADSDGMGFVVAEAANGLEAFARSREELPNILIVDAALDGALELIANIRLLPEGKSVRIYYCVIEADLKKMMAGKRAGADDFCSSLRPEDPDQRLRRLRCRSLIPP